MLQVSDLRVHFRLPRRVPWGPHSKVHAVDGISFEVPQGTTFGLVGESGSGKSTTALAVMRLVEITAGRIRLADTVLSDLEGDALRHARRDFQIIFQDPYSSLNPRTSSASSSRTSSRAASGSGSGWRGRSPRTHGSWCATNRCRRSTSRSRPRF